GAVFARHLLPGGLAVMLAERNRAALLVRRQQDAPAVVRHLHVIELGPTLGIDRHRGAQVDERLLEAVRPHGLPPVEVAGMPALERAQHLTVLGETDVVRDPGRVIDVDDIAHGVLLQWRMANSEYRIRGSSHRSAFMLASCSCYLPFAVRICALTPCAYRTPAFGRCRSA